VTIGGRGSNGTALRLTVMPIGVQEVLGLLAVQLGVAQVNQDQVHIGAAGDHGDAGFGDVGLGGGRRDLGALQDALLALLEFLGAGDLEGHGLGGDDVLQRAALLAGEDAELIFLAYSSLARMTAARTAEGLVRGGGDDVGVRHRVGCRPAATRPAKCAMSTIR
jgi:hypothetical protein